MAAEGSGAGEAVTLAEAEIELDKAGFELVTASGVGVFADAGDDDLGPGELAARSRVFRPELPGVRL